MTKTEFEALIQPHGLLIDMPTRTEKDGDYLYECFDDEDGKEIGFIVWRASEATYKQTVA